MSYGPDPDNLDYDENVGGYVDRDSGEIYRDEDGKESIYGTGD